MKSPGKRIVSLVRWSVIFGVALAMLGLMTTAALAHGTPTPPPYAGLKNPHPWNDSDVQAQGKALYTRTCIGCHGVSGSNVAAANFAAPEFAGALETAPDHYFWSLSEGVVTNGMPSFKSTLSEDERWQVLTYLWAIRQSAPATGPAGNAVPILSGGPMFLNPTIELNVTDDNAARSRLVLTAYLRDASGKPVKGQPVTFWLKKDFFAVDWMQIGEAASNADGKAAVAYPPSEDGNIQLAARWDNLEAGSGFGVTSRSATYRAVAGIHLPAIGPEVAVGLDVAAAELGEGSPSGGFRLPGGTFSWLLLFVGVIIAVWATYFRVFRQVILIPESKGGEGVAVKLVPYAAMVFVLVVGVVLAFVILHGPYTHLSLGR